MQKIYLLFIIFFSFKIICAQEITPAYTRQIQIADSLYKGGDYKKAASAYAIAFKNFGNKGLVDDRYYAACSYALSENADSAFINLFRIAEKAGWNNYELLISDTNLQTLRPDARWNKLVNKVRNNKAESDVQNEEMKNK
jgi:hypothetical protein